MRLDPALAHSWPAILLAILVAIVYPLIGLLRFRRIEHLPDPLPSRTRVRVYWNLLASQWTLVGLTAVLLAWGGRSLADLGQSLGPDPGGTILGTSILLVLFGILSVFTTRQLRRATTSELPRRMRKAGKILPQTDRERSWFVLVALTAGVCEEILYRGFLPWFIDGWLGGLGVGYVIAAVAFGLGHAYQGRSGMIVTGVLGLLFGTLAYYARSLVPGQVLHVAIDLVNGIAVGSMLVRSRAASASPGHDAGPGDVDAPAAPPHNRGMAAPHAELDAPRPLEAYERLSDAELDQRIRAAKAALGSRLLILGHHYQRDEIVQYADFLGDSYRLSQRGAQSSAEFIVFCGVHFMAESADILAQDAQRVILPDLGAGCSMADMADIADVEEAWDALTREFGDTFVPITYMNSTAAIKAFVGRNGGLVCTSSNAKAAFEWAWARGERIFFLPDEHLGRNTGTGLGLALDSIGLWDPRVDPRQALTKVPKGTRLVVWRGHCSVHQRFTPEQAEFLRKELPGIRVICHPECKYETCQAADLVGSTDFIIKTIENAAPGSKWAVGTEIHLVNRLAQLHPDRLVMSMQRNVCACATMYRIDPVHLCWVLENLAAGHVVNEIVVDAETIEWAKVALARMLEIR